MAVNKVVMNTANGTETLIDLTNDSVTPATLAAGVTAHDASGAIITGTATPVTLVQTTGESETAVMSQKAITDMKNSGELNGERGTGILKVTTAPSSYTTATGGFTPTYRIALSTVLSQSKATKVLIGDTLAYSYYHYPVGYVNDSYVYLGTRNSIRGATGSAGAAGANGTSVTVTSVSESTEDGGSNVVTFSDGRTLTVRNGNRGLDGASGLDGADGYTPVKGVDYDTPEDRAEIEAYIATELAKRGQLAPEFAQTIEDCTDTSKLYVLPDGYIYAYMYKEVAVGGYTNIADSTNSDFQAGKRVNASKAIVSGTATSFVSPVFSFAEGDLIWMKGITKGTGTSGTTPQWGIMFYNSSDTVIGSLGMFAEPPSAIGCVSNMKYWYAVDTSDDGVTKWMVAINENNVSYLPSGAVKARIFGVATNGFENVIVTVNEEIRDPEIVKEYQWANTGHAFVPADYEDRIIVLEAEDEEIRSEIASAKAETDEAIADLQEQIDSGAASAKSGARWFALGDSITEGWASAVDTSQTSGYRQFLNTNTAQRWVNIVAEKNGYELTNHGIGGTGFLHTNGTKYNARQLVDTLDFSQCDFVTLAYGVNDWKNAVNIGTMDDDIETGGSMVANMRYVIQKILGDNPYCKIFVITPISCRSYGDYSTNYGINYKGGTGGHLNGLGLQDIFDRMKEVCDYHGIELIDMTHNSVVNRENIRTALADYVHPTVECHAAMARELSKKIAFQ